MSRATDSNGAAVALHKCPVCARMWVERPWRGLSRQRKAYRVCDGCIAKRRWSERVTRPSVAALLRREVT